LSRRKPTPAKVPPFKSFLTDRPET